MSGPVGRADSAQSPSSLGAAVLLRSDGLDQLLQKLRERGCRVVGPTADGQVISLGTITTIDDLPVGLGDDQQPGRYRLKTRNDERRFAYAVGPGSPKVEMHPPRQPIWTIDRSPDGKLTLTESELDPEPIAFFGIRPCELIGLDRLDHVLADAEHPDVGYQRRRSGTWTVVVNCSSPSESCFCTSFGTGPFLADGPESDPEFADVVLSELDDGAGIRYLARAGSDRGRALLDQVDSSPAGEPDRQAESEQHRRSTEAIGRRLDTAGLRNRLAERLDAARWREIADRCEACGNCTSVCPTCFCTTPEDITNLEGDRWERTQAWDSCFSASFSELGGRPVRSTVGARYRQWATHKLGWWHDQFGESGCVGCGRCITWCPVGIDLPSEVAAIIGTEAS